MLEEPQKFLTFNFIISFKKQTPKLAFWDLANIRRNKVRKFGCDCSRQGGGGPNGPALVQIWLTFSLGLLKVLMLQIPTFNVYRADEGCLQWFTGPGGRIQSFNKADRNPTLLSNLLYTVCIRKWEGKKQSL